MYKTFRPSQCDGPRLPVPNMGSIQTLGFDKITIGFCSNSEFRMIGAIVLTQCLNERSTLDACLEDKFTHEIRSNPFHFAIFKTVLDTTNTDTNTNTTTATELRQPMMKVFSRRYIDEVDIIDIIRLLSGSSDETTQQLEIIYSSCACTTVAPSFSFSERKEQQQRVIKKLIPIPVCGPVFYLDAIANITDTKTGAINYMLSACGLHSWFVLSESIGQILYMTIGRSRPNSETCVPCKEETLRNYLQRLNRVKPNVLPEIGFVYFIIRCNDIKIVELYGMPLELLKTYSDTQKKYPSHSKITDKNRCTHCRCCYCRKGMTTTRKVISIREQPPEFDWKMSKITIPFIHLTTDLSYLKCTTDNTPPNSGFYAFKNHLT
jgi:hypothetical protein